MSRSRNLYIDDRAAVDHATEDEASDSGDDDPDATEAQIRQQDERDFQMSDICRGHQSRLVADALYCIPPDLLASGAATARPAQASASGTRTPQFGHNSGAPTMHDPPPFSHGQTSSVFSAPQASSSRKPPLFIPDSHDVTPYSYPGHLTPMSPAPFSPLRPSASQASSSRNPPLFIPGSRDATPYMYPGHLTSMSTAPFSHDPTPSMPSAASVQQSRSRGSSPDSSPSAKRPRLEEKGKARAHAATQFLDLAVLDSEDGTEDDEDDAMELDDADLAAMWLDADHPDDLRQFTHDYEHHVAAGGYDTHESYQAGDDFYDDDKGHDEPDPSLVTAVQSALHEVMPRPRPLPWIFLPVGTWILLQDKHKGRLALVVSMTECVVERQPRQQSMDPCEVITDFMPPLWRRKYAQSLVKPALDALLPFQLSKVEQLRGLIDFPLTIGTWIHLKGRNRGRPALVLSWNACLVEREKPPPVKPRDPNAPFVLEQEEQKQQQQAKKRRRNKNATERIDPCKILTNVKPFLLKKNYSPIIPSADELLPFEGSNYIVNIGAGDIIADGSSDDPQITAGTNCWVLDWLDNLAAMNEGEEDKIIGTSAAIWVSTQDPACVPMSLGKRPRVHGNEALIPFPSPPHQVGWVKGIEGNLIFVEPVDGSTTFQAELWQVRRDLRRGDSVVVVAGEYRGRHGIIVGAYWGGICEIWETKAASVGEVSDQMARSEMFRARVAHLNFVVERAPEAGDYSRHCDKDRGATASDRVSDAEATRPVLEVYRSESAKTTSLLYPQAAQPQFRRNRVECGPPEELDARNRCRMKCTTKLRSKRSMPQALQLCPGYGPRLWQYPVGTRVEAASGDGIKGKSAGGRRRRVVPPSGVDTVAVMVREAAAVEPRLGKRLVSSCGCSGARAHAAHVQPSQRVVSWHPHVPIERAATLLAKESIQLTLAEDEAARRAEHEGWMAATEVVDPASLGALRAALERLDAREESLEHVGKRFEGIRVRAVGTVGRSHFKGKVGMVLGDFDSPEHAHCLQAQKLDQRKHIQGDTDGIQVTVIEEITNAKFTVPIDQLVHDWTSLPLAQAKYLPNSILFAARQVVAPPLPRAPMPPYEQPIEDPAWVIDERDRFESFHLLGETTGEWLCCSAVAKKRVDVVLKGVKGFVRTKKMKSTAALERMEGHIRVLMLDAPIMAKSITEHKVDVYRIGPAAGPQEKKEPVPTTCLRPLRDNADGTSIITTRQRVVILGADVDGAEGVVGSYGETRPDVPHDHGEHFVVVKVVGYSMPRIYHVLRLCRSMNQAVYCPTGDYPATVF
ncbi:hypothetical protein FB451DRAFT_1186862 [Mycena latifolia]|nr:hypothetical protein FB451DRAFT_1186862 [Mycena latifolia]